MLLYTGKGEHVVKSVHHVCVHLKTATKCYRQTLLNHNGRAVVQNNELTLQGVQPLPNLNLSSAFWQKAHNTPCLPCRDPVYAVLAFVWLQRLGLVCMLHLHSCLTAHEKGVLNALCFSTAVAMLWEEGC